MLVEEIVDDIEVLLINDGSTDNTSSVLQDYEQRFPNVVRVIEKQNGGWGTAINLGIREAKGKYIKEVDADDWVSSESLVDYIGFLKNNEFDYVATEYSEYQKANDKYEHHGYMEEIYNKPMSLNEFWEKYNFAWAFPIHAITYRTQLLKDINLTVGERYYGDIEYNLYPLPHIKTICVIPINVTIYFRGSDEQSTSTKGYAKHYVDYVKMSHRITQFFLNHPEVPHNLYCFVEDTVRGTLTKAYYLMMSPVYAGNVENVKKSIRDHDKWLKTTNKKLYRHCGRQRKHGIAYIRLWRLTGVNILKFKV